MKKRLAIVVIILVIIVGLGLMMGMYLSHHRHQHRAFVTVTSATIQEKVVAVGNIVPERTAQVKSPIAGTVEQLFHDTGDYVTTTTKLLTIKPQPTPQSYATAEQTVKKDVVNEQKDQEDVERYRYLLKEGAISPNDQDYANARQQYQTDHLQEVLDEEQLSLLKQGKAVIDGHLIGNVIFSPVNGYVIVRNVNVGDPVSAQTDYQQGTLLFVVADMQHMIFMGQVSQTDAAKLHQGMTARLDIAAIPKRKIMGTLTKLELASIQANTQYGGSSSASSGGSGSGNGMLGTDTQNSPFNVGFQVEVSHLQLPRGVELRAGYSANAELIVKEVKNVPSLPERVLHFDEGTDKPYVWILGQNNKPTKLYIKTGASDGSIIEIKQGLKVGDKVIEKYPDNKPS